MPRFLLFTLYGPMAAHGEIAVGERRMGWDRPGRSAILGLVAAALGIERCEEERLCALDRALSYAVVVENPGAPIADFHTIQVPKSPRNGRFATRRDELAANKLNTILSQREWRIHALYTLALWPRAGASVDLDEIAGALERPYFCPYVGRRAAPLGWPLQPRILQAPTLVEALRTDPERDDDVRTRYLGASRGGRLACDAEVCDQVSTASSPDRIVVRRDRTLHHGRRQFAERREAIFDDWTVL